MMSQLKIFKLSVCFSLFTLLLDDVSAAFYSNGTHRPVEAYQMRLRVENIMEQRGRIISGQFPAGQSAMKFQLVVDLHGNGGFVLQPIPVSFAEFVYDLYVLDVTFDEYGFEKFVKRTSPPTLNTCSGSDCNTAQVMFPSSKTHHYISSDGRMDLHVDIVLLEECIGKCKEVGKVPYIASRCTIHQNGRKSCSPSDEFHDVTRLSFTWTTMELTKIDCGNVNNSNSVCYSISGIVSSIQKDLSAESQRSINSASSMLSEISEVKMKIAYAEDNRHKTDPCTRIGEKMDNLKSAHGNGVEKTGKQLSEISAEILKFKTDFLKTEADRPEHPCYALEKEVSNLRNVFDNGLSISDEKLNEIASEVKAFKKVFIDAEAVHPKKPCEELEAEISTLNDNYEDGVKQTDSRLNGIEGEIQKFRNDINTSGGKDNTCGAVPKKITMLEKSLANKFRFIKSGNDKLVEQFTKLVKVGNTKLTEEIAKLKKDEATANSNRANEKKLEDEKMARYEAKIKQLKDELKFKKNYNEKLTKSCKL